MAKTDRKLLLPERHEKLLGLLRNGDGTVARLSSGLGVSEATVRRDLELLEEAGKVRRVHGGAVMSKFPDEELVFEEKESIRSEEKNRIAALALDEIRDGDIVYLDGGSTVLALAKMLGPRRNLTIVTNSIMAVAELMESGHRLIVVGGELRKLSRTLVGPLTAQTIGTLKIQKAFLGTIGFTAEDGISTTDPGEAFTKELIMKRSEMVYLLADSSKLGKSSLAVSGSAGDIDVIITDRGIPAGLEKELTKKKIKIIK